MDSSSPFFATSGPTKRRKHYLCLLFSQYWVGVKTNQCSRHFSKKSILGLFYLEPHRKVNATTLELFTTNCSPQKKTTNPFSNLDFFVKCGFPKTRDLSPAAPEGVYISRNDPPPKYFPIILASHQNRHFLTKWLPFFSFSFGPQLARLSS